jgi:hypothetical protein
MRRKVGLAGWILTTVLMTLAIGAEFLGAQPLSFFGFWFVLGLALLVIGWTAEEWVGKESGFGRFWRSPANRAGAFVAAFFLVVLASAVLP